jgi:hypothetical protein
LARDPAARAEWDELNALAAKLKAAAAPPADVPTDFREKIMARLSSGASGPQRPGGGGSLPGAGLTAAGVVLVGLLGILITLDRQTSKPATPPQTQQVSEWLESPNHAAGGAQPAFRGQRARVNPEDIRSTASGQLPDARRRQPARLDGEAYMTGTGAGVTRPRSALVDRTSEGEASLPTVTATGMDLERFAAWSEEELSRRNVSVTLARLARTHRLHPGLLLAACQDLPGLTAEAVARRLRNSLDGSAGRPESERLRKAVEDLGGDATWLPRWKKSLSFSE